MAAPSAVSSAEAVTSARGEPGDRVLFASSFLCAIVPACLAGARTPNIADAAHDAAVVRVLGWLPAGGGGLGLSSGGSTLDVALGCLLAWLPIGTRATRAALASVLLLAAAGAVLFTLVRRLLAGGAAPRALRAAVAVIATTAPLLSAPFQSEAVAVGGGALGAVLILATLASADAAAARGTGRAWALFGGLAGAAAATDPLAFSSALGGAAAFYLASGATRRRVGTALGAHRSALAAGFALGLSPLALEAVRMKRFGMPLIATQASLAWGEPLSTAFPSSFLVDEVGVVVGALAVVGLLVACVVDRARPIAAGLGVIALVGLVSGRLGAPLGASQCGPTGLAALAALHGLASIPLQALVSAVAGAGVPLSRASAALIVLLEAALPIQAADDSLLRMRAEAGASAAAWDDAVWTTLPADTLALVADRRGALRAEAADAQGGLRGDLDLIVTSREGRSRRVGGAPEISRDDLAASSDLVPLWRDLALRGAPSEASLSAAALRRPVALTFAAGWDGALARHLVPLAMLDRFEPEPRGASDRRLALDAFAETRRRLAESTQGDSELLAASRSILRARAFALRLTGRELEDRAAEDLRAFTPAQAP